MNATISTFSPETILVRHRPSVCPWWLSWGLANPVRRWLDKPETLLGDFVQPGARVLEIGPGPGFFTVPMARNVGPSGKVICVDVQPRMLNVLRRRLSRAGLVDRIETYCSAGSSTWVESVQGTMDRAVLVYVLHEVPDIRGMLEAVYTALRPGGMFLLVEPAGHCSTDLFEAELWAARQAGFLDANQERWASLTRRQTALFRK